MSLSSNQLTTLARLARLAMSQTATSHQAKDAAYCWQVIDQAEAEAQSLGMREAQAAADKPMPMPEDMRAAAQENA